MQTRYGDVAVTLVDAVATVEVQRPPNNLLDLDLLRALATAFEALDNEAECRADHAGVGRPELRTHP